MNARELHLLLHAAQPPTLLHVLPPEIFAAIRIPGSVNACVFEMTFLDQVAALGLDPAAPLIIYGAGEGSLDAPTAAAKLRAAGLFPQLQIFAGGLAEWTAAGFPLEGTGQLPQPPVPHGTYPIDTAQSVIRWTGRNRFNHHSGTVRLGPGAIHLRHGQLLSARFTVAMDTIAGEDLPDSALNALLLAHLHSDDFFAIAQHPTAEFIATAVTALPACTEGTPNTLLRGTFTLRGITPPLEFPVLIAPNEDATRLTAQDVSPPAPREF